MAEWDARREALGRAVLASLLLHVALLSGLPGTREAAREARPGRVTVHLLPMPAPRTPAQAAPDGPVVASPDRSARIPRRTPSPLAAAGAASGAAREDAPPPRDRSAADAGSVAQYRLLVIAGARNSRPYPVVAREQGWQGRVDVRVAIDAAGLAESVEIRASSGYPVLDEAALAMLREAVRRTPAPAILRGRAFGMEIPVIFSLRDAVP